MIYLDMDGVIVDFFTGLAEFYKVSHWKEIEEHKIFALKGTNFFYRLNPYVGDNASTTLINYVNALSKGNWGICTSPLTGDRDNSAYHKRRWLEDREWFPGSNRFIVTEHKENYATAPFDGKPNILVDDKPANIKAWEDKGGIGIRYQANEDDLVEYLFVKLNEALKA